MMRLVSIKYPSKTNIHEHIIEMKDIAVPLNDIKISILDAFLIHFILISLSSKYNFFKISYNTHNEDWIDIELLAKYV